MRHEGWGSDLVSLEEASFLPEAISLTLQARKRLRPHLHVRADSDIRRMQAAILALRIYILEFDSHMFTH